MISTEGMSVLPGPMDMHVHLMPLGHADYRHWDLTYISPYEEHEKFVRWGVNGPEDARAKVQKPVDAGVDVIKLIDQDPHLASGVLV